MSNGKDLALTTTIADPSTLTANALNVWTAANPSTPAILITIGKRGYEPSPAFLSVPQAVALRDWLSDALMNVGDVTGLTLKV